jgi:hypothetical protein
MQERAISSEKQPASAIEAIVKLYVELGNILAVSEQKVHRLKLMSQHNDTTPCTINPAALRDGDSVRFPPIATKFVRQRSMSRSARFGLMQRSRLRPDRRALLCLQDRAILATPLFEAPQ